MKIVKNGWMKWKEIILKIYHNGDFNWKLIWSRKEREVNKKESLYYANKNFLFINKVFIFKRFLIN